MKYRRLGRTGLQVGEIGFGCWAIGGCGYGPTNDEESLEALETAWAHSVNFFDTADTYGHGHSEELLGRFFRDKPREQFIVATKAGWDFYHGASKKNFAPDYLHFACQRSLKRLGIDVIDIYQLHNPSLELIRQGDAVDALVQLKEEGKIRFVGVSVHREEEALAAIEDGGVDTIQLVFNLLDQRMSQRVFDEAVKKEIGIIGREPLACGLLTGKYAADHTFHKEDHRRRWTREKLIRDLQKVELVRKILTTNRLSLTQAALEYILNFDAISTVIPGAKTKSQVLENLQATENPCLRPQEVLQLRDLYQREEIFHD